MKPDKEAAKRRLRGTGWRQKEVLVRVEPTGGQWRWQLEEGGTQEGHVRTGGSPNLGYGSFSGNRRQQGEDFQWLGLPGFRRGGEAGTGSIPGWGTKTPRATEHR